MGTDCLWGQKKVEHAEVRQLINLQFLLSASKHWQETQDGSREFKYGTFLGKVPLAKSVALNKACVLREYSRERAQKYLLQFKLF